MKIVALIVFSAVFLVGCQSSSTVRHPEAGGYVGLAGAQFQLVEPVRIAAGRARVFIQDGVVPGGDDPLQQGNFDQYKTHCAFEIDSVDHQGVTIEPDTFQIVRVQHSIQQVVQSRPMMLASLDIAFGLVSGISGSYHEGYHFYLYSERQPEVQRVSCYGVYAQPYELEPPTLSEIRAALGDLAEIRR